MNYPEVEFLCQSLWEHSGTLALITSIANSLSEAYEASHLSSLGFRGFSGHHFGQKGAKHGQFVLLGGKWCSAISIYSLLIFVEFVS